MEGTGNLRGAWRRIETRAGARILDLVPRLVSSIPREFLRQQVKLGTELGTPFLHKTGERARSHRPSYSSRGQSVWRTHGTARGRRSAAQATVAEKRANSIGE